MFATQTRYIVIRFSKKGKFFNFIIILKNLPITILIFSEKIKMLNAGN